MSRPARAIAAGDRGGASPRPIGSPARWFRNLLVALVAVVMVALVLVPILMGRREDALHERISGLVVPARGELAMSEVELARAMTAFRFYLLNQNPRDRRRLAAALVRHGLYAAQLTALAAQLGPEIARQEAELRRRLELWSRVPYRLLAGRVPRDALVDLEALAESQARFEAVLQAATALDRSLLNVEERLRGEIDQLQATERLLVLVLSLAALGIVVVVLWLLSRLASLARQLRRRADEMTALLESTGDGILGLDQSGRCTFLNRAGAEMLGYRPEEALGREVHELIQQSLPGGTPYPEEECLICRAVFGAQSVRAEGEVLWRGGRAAFPVEYTAYPLLENGEPRGAVVRFTDITERRRAEAALREREERFRVLYEDNPSIYFTVTPDGTILSVNRFGAESLGYTSDELIGRPVFDIVFEAERDKMRDQLTESTRSPGETFRWEFRKVRKDGTILWVREVARAVRQADGSVAILIACFDVTDAKRVEEERERLIQSEREARASAEAARSNAEHRAREESALRLATEAVTTAHTLETTIRQIAEGALTATDALGAFVERIDPEEKHLEVVAVAGAAVPALGERIPYGGSAAERAIESQRPELLANLSRYEGAKFPSLLEVCPRCALLIVSLLEAGQAIGALVLLRAPEQPPFRADEIERAETFADLAALAFRKMHLLEESQKRRDELERVMTSRERLVRGFSHDVKNPLGAADGHLQILEEGIVGPLQPEQQESVARVRRSIRSALELIEALVDLARAEAGRIELQNEPVDMREVASATAEEYRAQAETAGLSLHVDVRSDLPVIESDASRIRQILGNLLSNAVKYTEQGGLTVAVGIRARDEAHPGRWMAVDVADTGPGIPPETQRLLFQEFRRFEPDTGRGAGLGLAISYRLAQLLGGDLTVESQVDVGSTFTLWLPLRGRARTAERQPEKAA